jgi:cytochrome c553
METRCHSSCARLAQSIARHIEAPVNPRRDRVPRRSGRARSASTIATLALALIAPATAIADAKAGEKKVQLCLLCHKSDNPGAWLPTLEGQTREYLVAQIKAYKEKRRSDTGMQTNTMRLSDRDIRDIADYFAARPPVRGSFTLDAARVARGKVLADEAQCGQCHGADYGGRREVPRLAGMEPRYSAAQLLAFVAGTRAHPADPGLSSLTMDDATNIAQYLAGLE